MSENVNTTNHNIIMYSMKNRNYIWLDIAWSGKLKRLTEYYEIIIRKSA